ncbi:MAG: 2-amino-4-hydroxy-6-hydroxymethyldihydropteridine diphosphokinase, partial [Planctomycetota bacterium]
MPIVHPVFLSLGSNIAPERHLPLAVARLQLLGDVLAASRVWQSPPADGSEQSHYLNAAVLLATEATAEELYGCRLPEIETALGRLRDPGDRYAPRTIDIDISLFDR